MIKGEIINLDNKILINETSISIKCRKISNTAETIHYFFVIAYKNNLWFNTIIYTSNCYILLVFLKFFLVVPQNRKKKRVEKMASSIMLPYRQFISARGNSKAFEKNSTQEDIFPCIPSKDFVSCIFLPFTWRS